MNIQCHIWIIGAVLSVKATQVTISSSKSWYEDKETVVLTCTVPDFTDTVEITGTQANIIVSCYPELPSCTPPPSGYTANKRGTTMLDLSITSFDHTRDTGDWTCSYRLTSSTLTLYHAIPVSTATLQPEGINNIVSVIFGVSTTFTCTTDASRPAAWIQWYIGGRNVTNDAVLQTPQPNGTKFISSSKLMYNVSETVLNTTIQCEAVNFEEKPKVESIRKTIYIQVLVDIVTIKPYVMERNVSVLPGGFINFTCTTGASRPAAWILWYIGGRNVTNDAVPQIPQPDGTKFISSSKLMYTGDENDHNKPVYCEALNVEGQQKARSEEVYVYVQVPVTGASIQPLVDQKVSVKIGNKITINCTTSASRPAAWIQWYIGGRNVTNDAVLQTPQPNGTKFISSSKLVYTGDENDHNKAVYCEAVNVEGQQKARSEENYIYIQIPVTAAMFKPGGVNQNINVMQGSYVNLTCITDASRPAAWIQWYIGGRNVTNDAVPQIPQPDGTKFISSSKLTYTGNNTDHNASVHCRAGNIEGEPKVNSTKNHLFIKLQVEVVSITSLEHIVISGIQMNFTCTARNSRPAAWINWYIGNIDVTQNAIKNTELVSSKYNTVSVLKYIGSIEDHGKMLICTAGTFGETFYKTDNISFVINSSPVADGILKSYVEVQKYQEFILQISLIANPKPNITWIFVNSSGFHVPLDKTLIKTEPKGAFHYITSYGRQSVVDSDFGNYTVMASNSVGDDFFHFIYVVSTLPTITDGQTSNGLIIGSVVGTIIVIAIGIVVSAFVLYRRKNDRGNQKENLQRSEVNDTDSSEDGLKDNPLYMSSDETTLHMQTIKKENDKTMFKNSAAHIKGKSKEKGRSDSQKPKKKDYVYENPEDICNGTEQQLDERDKGQGAHQLPFQSKKNKDGLLYVDLAFVPSKKNNKIVIRGLENRTNYAIIDLTKTAEPLPDSDEDDVLKSELIENQS